MLQKICFLISFIVGLLLWQNPWWGIVIYCLLLFCLLAKKYQKIIIVLIIGSFIGFFRISAEYLYLNHQESLLMPGQKNYQGQIVQLPRQTKDAQWLMVKYQISSRVIRVMLKTDLYPVYQRGQFISWQGDFQLSKDNKHSSYGGYLLSQRVVAIFYQPRIRIINNNQKDSWLDYFKLQTIKIIKSSMLEPESSIMVAYFFGDDDLIPDQWQELYRRVGISHVIAISGMHIMIMAMLFQRSLYYLFLNKKITLILVMVILTSYVLMIGNQASAIRALLMFLIITMGEILSRPRFSFYTLLLVAVLTLVYQPLLLFYDLGWQLSFLAVAGLMFLTKYTQQIFKGDGMIAQTLAATLAAMIMTGPWLAYKFSGLSLWAPLANILVIPTFDFLLSLGLVSLVIIWLWPTVGTALLQICWLIIHQVNNSVQYLDQQIVFYHNFNTPSIVFVFFIYSLIIIIINYNKVICYFKKTSS